MMLDALVYEAITMLFSEIVAFRNNTLPQVNGSNVGLAYSDSY